LDVKAEECCQKAFCFIMPVLTLLSTLLKPFRNNFEVLEHPPYSPGLALPTVPCEVHLMKSYEACG
jgi:hypothetical protein